RPRSPLFPYTTLFRSDLTKAEFVDGEPFMPPDRQLELFEGCAYVLDRHQIFTKYGMLDQQRFNAQYGGWNFSMDAQNRKVSTSPDRKSTRLNSSHVKI